MARSVFTTKGLKEFDDGNDFADGKLECLGKGAKIGTRKTVVGTVDTVSSRREVHGTSSSDKLVGFWRRIWGWFK